MVSLTIDKAALARELGVPLSKDIIDRIPMMGVEVEEETPTQLVLDITPNRPDMLSQPGFARALASYIGAKPGLRAYTTTPSKLRVTVDESVRDVRPFTACAVVRNLKLDEEKLKEIIDIQEKLHITFCRKRKKAAIGIYPMENIIGNITFAAFEPEKIRFRPLESESEMSAKEILEQHPKGKEYAYLLQGLPRYAVFMDSKKRVLSLTPIINSHETGKITTKTTEAFLECSGFSQRMCDEVVRIMSAALADMGASLHTVDVVYSRKTEVTPNMTAQRQEFYGYYANRRLGVNIRKEEFATLLARMGLGFEQGRIKETYYALIPPYRVDFLHQIDVVEDLAIAYGYENIRAELPNIGTIAGLSVRTRMQRVLRKILVGQGLLEAKNYHLVSKQHQIAIDGDSDVVTLTSSVSEEHDSLRKTLLPGMLQMLARNKIHEYPQHFFELGTVFTAGAESVGEHSELCIALAGDVDYTRIRQAVDGLLLATGLVGTYAAAADVRFLKGRCASVAIDGIVIGTLGEVAPRALAHAQLPVPVAAALIDADALQALILK